MFCYEVFNSKIFLCFLWIQIFTGKPSYSAGMWESIIVFYKNFFDIPICKCGSSRLSIVISWQRLLKPLIIKARNIV